MGPTADHFQPSMCTTVRDRKYRPCETWLADCKYAPLQHPMQSSVPNTSAQIHASKEQLDTNLILGSIQVNLRANIDAQIREANIVFPWKLKTKLHTKFLVEPSMANVFQTLSHKPKHDKNSSRNLSARSTKFDLKASMCPKSGWEKGTIPVKPDMQLAHPSHGNNNCNIVHSSKFNPISDEATYKLYVKIRTSWTHFEIAQHSSLSDQPCANHDIHVARRASCISQKKYPVIHNL